ncbi:MAG: GPR endopeptidase [Oscillospiraceae bacterium]
MDKRTGLAEETARLCPRDTGARIRTHKFGEATITEVAVDKAASRMLRKPPGRYITIEGEPNCGEVSVLLGKALTQFLPSRGRLLAAGLGNPAVTHDSLGALAVRSIAPKDDGAISVTAFETDIAARTGIETARMVRAVADEIGADCILAIDALACSDIKRIGKTVQITNAGIIPGSGAANRRTEITRRTMGIPVVAVGVPTAAELSAITGKSEDRGYLVLAGDVDILTKIWAESIAEAVNRIAEKGRM